MNHIVVPRSKLILSSYKWFFNWRLGSTSKANIFKFFHNAQRCQDWRFSQLVMEEIQTVNSLASKQIYISHIALNDNWSDWFLNLTIEVTDFSISLICKFEQYKNVNFVYYGKTRLAWEKKYVKRGMVMSNWCLLFCF